MHILQRYSTRNPASNMPCGQRVGSCQSPGRNTRPKQSIASRFPCDAMTPVSSQGADFKGDKSGRTKKSSGPLAPPPLW